MRHFNGSAKNQKGMTLLVALITLIMLMLLGLSAMQASNTMSKLAGNLQFQNEAMNRAEIALIAGENLLKSNVSLGVAGCSDTNTIPPSPTNSLPFHPATPILNPLTTWPSPASSVDAAGAEQFVIQKIGNSNPLCNSSEGLCGTVDLYRVIARGQTMRGAVRYLESVVQVPLCD